MAMRSTDSAAISMGSSANDASEGLGEMTLIRETAFERDLGNALVIETQEADGPLDAAMQNVAVNRHLKSVAETPGKMTGTHPGQIREIAYAQILRQRSIDEFRQEACLRWSKHWSRVVAMRGSRFEGDPTQARGQCKAQRFRIKTPRQATHLQLAAHVGDDRRDALVGAGTVRGPQGWQRLLWRESQGPKPRAVTRDAHRFDRPAAPMENIPVLAGRITTERARRKVDIFVTSSRLQPDRVCAGDDHRNPVIRGVKPIPPTRSRSALHKEGKSKPAGVLLGTQDWRHHVRRLRFPTMAHIASPFFQQCSDFASRVQRSTTIDFQGEAQTTRRFSMCASNPEDSK